MGRLRHARLFRMLSLSLTAALAAGCMQRRAVTFTSVPSGATVKVGKQTGITPCTLDLPVKHQEAEISLPLYPPRYVQIRPLFDTGPRLVKAIAGPASVVGGVGVLAGLILLGGDDDSEAEISGPTFTVRFEGHGGGDDDAAWAVVGVSVGVALISTGIYYLADYADDSRLEPEAVHVDFVGHHAATESGNPP